MVVVHYGKYNSRLTTNLVTTDLDD
jgi:hypothetical protein